MTEESVETLFALGREELIVGVSAYVRRPPAARKLPKISVFTHANLKKIKSLSPDLILGFSDIQKDIARELIGEGLNVFITNQRSIEEILQYILLLGSMVGERAKAKRLMDRLIRNLERIREKAALFPKKPKIYFEEWDDPMISGIRWISELVEWCGGIDVAAPKQGKGALAKDRIVSAEEIRTLAPDIILASWCGKKVEMTSFAKRAGWKGVPAVRDGEIYELAPEIFLQPGPAPLTDGAPILYEIFSNWVIKGR